MDNSGVMACLPYRQSFLPNRLPMSFPQSDHISIKLVAASWVVMRSTGRSKRDQGR